MLELWGMWSTPSLPLLPCSLQPKVLVAVSVPAMGQIILYELFVFDGTVAEKKNPLMKQLQKCIYEQTIDMST